MDRRLVDRVIVRQRATAHDKQMRAAACLAALLVAVVVGTAVTSGRRAGSGEAMCADGSHVSPGAVRIDCINNPARAGEGGRTKPFARSAGQAAAGVSSATGSQSAAGGSGAARGAGAASAVAGVTVIVATPRLNVPPAPFGGGAGGGAGGAAGGGLDGPSLGTPLRWAPGGPPSISIAPPAWPPWTPVQPATPLQPSGPDVPPALPPHLPPIEPPAGTPDFPSMPPPMPRVDSVPPVTGTPPVADNPPVRNVPEPGSLILFGTALLAVALVTRTRRRASPAGGDAQ